MEGRVVKNLISRFVREEEGQDIIEYALLGSFVAFGAYESAGVLGTAYNNWMKGIAGSVDSAAALVP